MLGALLLAAMVGAAAVNGQGSGCALIVSGPAKSSLFGQVS